MNISLITEQAQGVLEITTSTNYLDPNCIEVKDTAPQDLAVGTRQPSGLADSQSDFGALVYIVVVLIFYSTGVMVMIVRYLKTEKKELEEEATLENFFRLMPDPRQEKELRVNQVAIHAFHTLTSISYDDEELDDLDIINDPDTPKPLLPNTRSSEC